MAEADGGAGKINLNTAVKQLIDAERIRGEWAEAIATARNMGLCQVNMEVRYPKQHRR